MTDPRIVTPEEARELLRQYPGRGEPSLGENLRHTVATEPDRTRAAVVKAMRSMAEHITGRHLAVGPTWIKQYADAIKNGAPL